MFNLSKFSPALKGGALLLPVSASEPGNLVPRNAHQWRQVAEFLDAQWLASFSVRRTVELEREARRGPACGVGPRVSAPHGNHGDKPTFNHPSVSMGAL